MDIRNISERLFREDSPMVENLTAAGRVEEPPPAAQTVFGVVLLVACLTGVLGNGLALQALYACKALRQPKHYLVANLCVTNGLMCLVYCCSTVPASFAHTWPFGELGRDVVGFSVSVMTVVLMTSQLAIAAQRVAVAVSPLAAAYSITHGKMLTCVAATWVYSTVVMLPPLFGWNRFTIDRSGVSVTFDYAAVDGFSRAYTFALLVLAFVVPLLGIVCCYSYIFVTVRRSRREAKLKHTELTSRRDRKTVVVAMCLTALFCVSWTPCASVVVLTQCKVTVSVTYVMVAAAVAKCASSVDPMMFAFSLPVVRKYYCNRKRLGKYIVA